MNSMVLKQMLVFKIRSKTKVVLVFYYNHYYYDYCYYYLMMITNCKLEGRNGNQMAISIEILNVQPNMNKMNGMQFAHC